MAVRRVVITGMGCVNALGRNVEEFWGNAKQGRIGIAPIIGFDVEAFKVKVAAEIKDLDILEYLPSKLAKRTERFTHLAMIAAKEAVEKAGLLMEQEDPYRVGVCVSSGIGGLSRISKETLIMNERGPNKVSPMTVPLVIGNMAPANIAMMFGMQGKCIGVTSACSTGTDSIGEAYQSIQAEQCDVMLAGGSDAVICPQGIAAFGQLQALTTEADPARASIPFDKDRSGFVMGEGAGVEDGEAAAKAMELAMENAGVSPDQISYINAHGTSTYYNDLYETRAIKKAFGQYAHAIPINSTKSLIGHTLGGSGAMEAIVCLLSMRDSYLHVTAGLQETEGECDLDYIKGTGRKQEVEVSMSNSFGFGGHNSILIFKKYKE